ncbi:MAG: hypothetical protein HYX27_18515 [Acidobacteria bacterium]|nr:hypothetical protein [Acidobacteriota bacterium]
MSFLSRRAALTAALPLLTRANAQVTPAIVRFDAEMEPLVRLIEDTPREKCAAMAKEQLRANVPYRQLMAALYLAGVRNVNPRPPGFALHCLFVMHAAHLLSLEAPPDLRALPFFYALDLFKISQERDARQNDYVMAPLTGRLPSPDRAAAELTAAMEAWDQDRAERAAAVLARTRGANEVFELLWRYGVRDYRNIGHKAIFVANSYRTLQTIGWQHGETVMRSLVLGILDFAKDTKVNGYALDDQTYGANSRRPAVAWSSEAPDNGATHAALSAIRSAPPVEACDTITGMLVKGTPAASIWDAVHLAAAELTMRTAGGGIITGIHSVSAANAMHFAWQTAADPKTRQLTLLQAAGWMGQFRTWAETQKGIRALDITKDEVPPEIQSAEGRMQHVAGHLRHIIPKANEVHFYKFPAALIEDIPLVSREWRPHLAAAMNCYTKGPKDAETDAMQRARAV